MLIPWLAQNLTRLLELSLPPLPPPSVLVPSTSSLTAHFSQLTPSAPVIPASAAGIQQQQTRATSPSHPWQPSLTNCSQPPRRLSPLTPLSSLLPHPSSPRPQPAASTPINAAAPKPNHPPLMHRLHPPLPHPLPVSLPLPSPLCPSSNRPANQNPSTPGIHWPETTTKKRAQTVSRRPDPLWGSGRRETVPPFTPAVIPSAAQRSREPAVSLSQGISSSFRGLPPPPHPAAHLALAREGWGEGGCQPNHHVQTASTQPLSTYLFALVSSLNHSSLSHPQNPPKSTPNHLRVFWKKLLRARGSPIPPPPAPLAHPFPLSLLCPLPSPLLRPTPTAPSRRRIRSGRFDLLRARELPVAVRAWRSHRPPLRASPNCPSPRSAAASSRSAGRPCSRT